MKKTFKKWAYVFGYPTSGEDISDLFDIKREAEFNRTLLKAAMPLKSLSKVKRVTIEIDV